MKVEQIMSHEVVTVTPETSLKDVAGLLARHQIAGVPVCDAEGRVVGVVSEADILWKELGIPPSKGGVIDWILKGVDGASVRAAARTAGDAMTSPALTVTPAATVRHAARLMIDHNINRLPVLSDGRLVGIVARSDLVRAFKRSDEEIEEEISDDVLLRTLWVDPNTVSLVVSGGDVQLAGEVENRSTAELVEAYVRRVPGVVSVHSDLTWQQDDLARRTTRSANQLPQRL